MKESSLVNTLEVPAIAPTAGHELALLDFKDSLSKYRLWAFLSWSDIKMRYRGSSLGPFWITLSMMIFIGAFSLVYSRLFHQPLQQYIPFLTTGYLVWLLISSTLTESCNIFVEAAPLITEIKLPYTLYIFRLISRQIIIFFHNAVVYVLVALLFKLHLHWNFLLFFPGLFLLILNLTSISLLLALLGTKYRDIPQVISSIIQVAFFVTPISWAPNLLSSSIILKMNPLSYFIDLVRSPLLGQSPEMASWVVGLCLTIITLGVSFLLFSKLRRNIPFWI